jgi:Fungal Zn(2)-Cys(6) binuclear cluster domain
MSSGTTSLRRSCQGCVKVKRRCDLIFPECSRCLKKGVRCQYTNIPLSSRTSPLGDGRVSKPVHTRPQQQQPPPPPQHHHPHAIAATKAKGHGITVIPINTIADYTQISDSSDDNDNDFENVVWIRPSLDMEIRKYHSPQIVDLITQAVCRAPRLFAQGESFFIHPCVYGKTLPRSVRDILSLCSMYESDSDSQPSPPKLGMLLQRQIVSLLKSSKELSDFEDLVACVQALTLAQCIQLSNGNIRGPGVEKSLDILAVLARNLWYAVPRQLPSSMSPWRAWVFAETVRRTIVFSHLVIAAFSFLTRGYACRTPFIDALPFDGRTYLWDARSEDEWENINSGTDLPMVSLIEYADLLQSGRTLCFSSFEGLIITTCRGLVLPIHDPSSVIQM